MNNFRIGDKVEWLGTSGNFTKDGRYTLHTQYLICCIDNSDNTFKVVDEYDYSLWVNGEDFKLVGEVSKPLNEISLTLSQDEAQMLADVLACVEGCPALSRRKFTNRVSNKLRSFDIAYEDPEYADQVDLSGTINCKTIFEPERESPTKETVEYNGSTYDKAEFDSMLDRLEKL